VDLGVHATPYEKTLLPNTIYSSELIAAFTKEKVNLAVFHSHNSTRNKYPHYHCSVSLPYFTSTNIHLVVLTPRTRFFLLLPSACHEASNILELGPTYLEGLRSAI